MQITEKKLTNTNEQLSNSCKCEKALKKAEKAGILETYGGTLRSKRLHLNFKYWIGITQCTLNSFEAAMKFDDYDASEDLILFHVGETLMRVDSGFNSAYKKISFEQWLGSQQYAVRDGDTMTITAEEYLKTIDRETLGELALKYVKEYIEFIDLDTEELEELL